MQHRMINNKFTVSLVFSLLATLAVPAVAGNSGNPWALPQPPEKVPDFQRSPQYGNQPYYKDQTDIQYPGFRFVTPEILESLKQQQIQTQQVPGNDPYRRYRRPPPPQPQQQLMSEPPMQEHYGFPPTGMGFSNPLYDTPAVSPWGSGPDVMYRGESFPWVPDAAIGGIPPMNVTPFTGSDEGSNWGGNGENNEKGNVGSGRAPVRNNVFNPFTFGPNGNL